MWIDEYTSSFTRRSDRTIASSKLCPYQGMNATSTFAPSASSPRSVPAPSATICPAFTFWSTCTSGRWLMAVSWLVRQRSEEHTSNSSHGYISYAVFCLKKKKTQLLHEQVH